MMPSMSSTSCFTILRPRPLWPSPFVDVPGENRASRTVSGMPAPVSVTSISTQLRRPCQTAPVWQGRRNWVEMEVTDTGAGIPDTVREALFSPGTSTKGEGHSGLGLSIVKQLVDDMEGIIACHTGQKGTT